MDYTLIANSGIQMFTVHATINLDGTYKQLFHEEFNEETLQWKLEFAYKLEEINKFVKKALLRQKGYLSADDTLTTTETDVISNVEIEASAVDADSEELDGYFYVKLDRNRIEKFFNQWLPIPYLEKDEADDYKCGPYNWSRCKIIPSNIEGATKNSIDVDILFAFDTRSIYGEDPFHECPIFNGESESEKRFQLCGNDGQLFDYIVWNDSFVRDTILGLTHPGVTDFDQLSISNNGNKYDFLASYITLISYLSEVVKVPIIRLVGDRGARKVSVEMILDIGNSRTSGLLFEEQDFTRVDTLKLQNFLEPMLPDGKLNRVDESFDMRLAFNKTTFGKNFIGSSQFLWPSLVRLGREAQYLSYAASARNLGDESISTYSSPKRYLWDFKASENEWRLVGMGDDNNLTEPPVIEGLTNNFNDDGTLEPSGYGFGAHYSRRSLMIFAFIEILQHALVQINSNEVRTANGMRNTPRSLDRIILTCPTAMSEFERKSLADALRQAIVVINRYNQSIDPSSPELKIEVLPEAKSKSGGQKQWFFDEATCSQLVFLYGQLCQRYKNSSVKFFEMYGKKREVEGFERQTINVGTVDIGAGTTDVMICQYAYDSQNPSRIKPNPLFWESFNQAGDDMLQVLVKNVIIEGDDAILSKILIKKGIGRQQCHRLLYRFFAGDNNMMTFENRMIRRDFNVQVSIPVIYRFLELLAQGEHFRELRYEDVFSWVKPSLAVENSFKEVFGFDLQDVVWTFDRDVVGNYVYRAMDGLIEVLANLFYAYDCDLVLLAGRPTMLSPIRDCFLKYFSVSPNRLISLGRYRIGEWYPFCNENGFMNDTKTLVPVGAMIGYLASRASGLNEFSVDLSELDKKLRPTTDYFVRMATNSREKCFVTPDVNMGKLQFNTFPVYIGCKQFDNAIYPPRPFYVLDINTESMLQRINRREENLSKEYQYRMLQQERERLLSHGPFVVTLERDTDMESKERLSISSFESVEGMQLNRSDIALTVQSLNDPECYWLDSGAFNLNIATIELKMTNHDE